MSTTSKAAQKKKPTTTKNPASKKNTVRKNSKKNVTMKSFRVYPNAQPFVSFKPTKQTFYWVVLLIFIILLQLWMLKMQLEIVELANSISMQ